MFDINQYSIAVWGQPLSYLGDRAEQPMHDPNEFTEYLDTDEPMMEEVPC